MRTSSRPAPVAPSPPGGHFWGMEPSTSNRLLDRLRGWFEACPIPGVVSARLFGSHSEGRAHRESDVDVAVLLDRGLHPRRLDRSNVRVDLTGALIGLLHHNEVDVVVLNDAPPLFARRILHEGIPVVVADEGSDRAFGDLVRSRAADLQPWLTRMGRLKLEALRR